MQLRVIKIVQHGRMARPPTRTVSESSARRPRGVCRKARDSLVIAWPQIRRIPMKIILRVMCPFYESVISTKRAAIRHAARTSKLASKLWHQGISSTLTAEAPRPQPRNQEAAAKR